MIEEEQGRIRTWIFYVEHAKPPSHCEQCWSTDSGISLRRY